MHIQSLFKPLEELERNLSILYKKLSDHFSSDPESRLAFYRLHLDEKSHLALVQYQKRLVAQNPKHFQEIQLNLEEVKELAERADQILWTKREVSLREAFDMALSFETRAAEYHYRSALRLANPEISDLIRNLGNADEIHLKTLLDFGARKGLCPPPPMEPAPASP